MSATSVPVECMFSTTGIISNGKRSSIGPAKLNRILFIHDNFAFWLCGLRSAQPPGTLFLPTSTTLLTPVHSENDSRVYFMIVLTTDYCWRSWTCRIAAPYKFHVDWLIDWLMSACSQSHGSIYIRYWFSVNSPSSTFIISADFLIV